MLIGGKFWAVQKVRKQRDRARHVLGDHPKWARGRHSLHGEPMIVTPFLTGLNHRNQMVIFSNDFSLSFMGIGRFIKRGYIEG